jgi:hypothetical protein
MTTTQPPADAGAASRGSAPLVIYALLAVVGTVLPYAYFIPFVMEHGLNLGEFLTQAFDTFVASMLSLDILLSSVVFWVFMWVEAKRLDMRAWPLLILPNLLVGLSCALPLFLLWRELRLRQRPA